MKESIDNSLLVLLIQTIYSLELQK